MARRRPSGDAFVVDGSEAPSSRRPMLRSREPPEYVTSSVLPTRVGPGRGSRARTGELNEKEEEGRGVGANQPCDGLVCPLGRRSV